MNLEGWESSNKILNYTPLMIITACIFILIVKTQGLYINMNASVIKKYHRQQVPVEYVKTVTIRYIDLLHFSQTYQSKP